MRKMSVCSGRSTSGAEKWSLVKENLKPRRLLLALLRVILLKERLYTVLLICA